jgi:hypothetical protein
MNYYSDPKYAEALLNLTPCHLTESNHKTMIYGRAYPAQITPARPVSGYQQTLNLLLNETPGIQPTQLLRLPLP